MPTHRPNPLVELYNINLYFISAFCIIPNAQRVPWQLFCRGILSFVNHALFTHRAIICSACACAGVCVCATFPPRHLPLL